MDQVLQAPTLNQEKTPDLANEVWVEASRERWRICTAGTHHSVQSDWDYGSGPL